MSMYWELSVMTHFELSSRHTLYILWYFTERNIRTASSPVLIAAEFLQWIHDEGQSY
jgi:hypothetical protein